MTLYKIPVAPIAFLICRRENPISRSGVEIGSGGGEWDLALGILALADDPI
jgi:hypothetical protein